MRRYREMECSEWSPETPLRATAVLRSYRTIAAILNSQDRQPHVTAESVGKMCAAAERRLAAALREDPIVARWLRRKKPESANPESVAPAPRMDP